MAIDTTIWDADLDAMIADLPVNAVLDDQTVVCSKTVLSADDRAADAGLLEDYVFSLHSSAADWTEGLPEIGDLITIDSTEYRVLRIVSDTVGLRLDMGAKYTSR